MKLDMMTTKNGTIIPPAALRASGFGPHEGVECNALNGCVVALKKTMNAMELIRAAWSLYELSTDLVAHLAGECGSCDGKCDSCDGECPYSEEDFSVDMQIPEEFREIADIPDGAVLHVEFPEEGGILLCEGTGDPPELWDVPAPMMAGLLASSICPASLEILLKSGDTVYGE